MPESEKARRDGRGSFDEALDTLIVAHHCAQIKGAMSDEFSWGNKDDIGERLFGKTAMRMFERRAEIEHERKLAAIRSQSHAMTWTGTPDDLIATITTCYQSGWIVADNLQDALQKAARHFVKPDGTLVITPAVRADLEAKPEDGATIEAEVQRRARLLASYKSATGNPSNKRIYEASNSGIHKPEFYQWRNGTLSSDSATCLNFERFLREKRPPRPRKPHN